jgi:hypothetical protein
MMSLLQFLPVVILPEILAKTAKNAGSSVTARQQPRGSLAACSPPPPPLLLCDSKFTRAWLLLLLLHKEASVRLMCATSNVLPVPSLRFQCLEFALL